MTPEVFHSILKQRLHERFPDADLSLTDRPKGDHLVHPVLEEEGKLVVFGHRPVATVKSDSWSFTVFLNVGYRVESVGSILVDQGAVADLKPDFAERVAGALIGIVDQLITPDSAQ